MKCLTVIICTMKGSDLQHIVSRFIIQEFRLAYFLAYSLLSFEIMRLLGMGLHDSILISTGI